MRRLIVIPAVALCFSLSSALAGPVIIDGTDANDHGSVSGGANTAGWLYMQRALENVGSQVGNGNTIVVDLGTSTGTARNAINSAFGLSSLAASWTLVHIDGATDIASYLGGGTVGGASLANTGIIYLPTANLSGGDMSTTELAAVNTGANAIATFVGGAGDPTTGGGLFSMGETGTGAYGWLQTLIPGIVSTDAGGGGIGTNITLTPAGVSAFPGLTNADLAGADPWHGYFSGNLGSLSVLGTASQGANTRNVILGGGAGTVITPDPPTGVPDSGSTIALMSLGLLGLAALRKRLNA